VADLLGGTQTKDFSNADVMTSGRMFCWKSDCKLCIECILGKHPS
jgi:hypothetical protein